TTTYFFFFQTSPQHPDLPPFPTRRSSDLGRRQRPRPGPHRRGRQQEQVLEGHVHIRRRGRSAVRLRSRRCSPHRRPGHQPVHQADRKSTRLNSSHVSISYAVFCLKKKKTK